MQKIAKFEFKKEPQKSDIIFQYNDCGGNLNGPVNEIRSSGTDMDCVWVLNYEEGQQIVLSRFSVNMEHSDTVTCGQRGASYVTIRNGGTVNIFLVGPLTKIFQFNLVFLKKFEEEKNRKITAMPKAVTK